MRLHFCVFLVVHTEDLADGPPISSTTRAAPNPTTPRDSDHAESVSSRSCPESGVRAGGPDLAVMPNCVHLLRCALDAHPGLDGSSAEGLVHRVRQLHCAPKKRCDLAAHLSKLLGLTYADRSERHLSLVPTSDEALSDD